MSAELPRLPARPVDGHKGTFGTVCVLGGQAGGPRIMIGGPALSALAALRAGAGLAVLAVPAPLMSAALTIAPSATGLSLPTDDRGNLRPAAVAELLDEHLEHLDCLAVGPGLGADAQQQQIMARLIGREHPPIVIDADAINALAGLEGFDRDLRAATVFTPHPGEYARLARSLEIDADPVDPQQRPAAAKTLAQRIGCIVVLKGAGTVVSDGIRTWTNTTGNPALATAGTGDVLTGVIAGLVAQYASRPDGPLSLYDCARIGVHAHGLAADRWRDANSRTESGMLAADLLGELPGALAGLR